MVSVKSATPPPPRISEGDGERENILPSLVAAYEERGYESGYARGVNEALAAVLEATEDFARLRPESPDVTRRLLYAFSKYLEGRVRRTPPQVAHEFVDGLGI
jgi:hypothetical protein